MKTAIVFVDHGLTIGYYLFTGLAERLTGKGVRLVFLVEEDLVEKLRKDFAANPLLVFELGAARTSARNINKPTWPACRRCLNLCVKPACRASVPLTYVDTHRQRKEFEANGRWKFILNPSARPFPSCAPPSLPAGFSPGNTMPSSRPIFSATIGPFPTRPGHLLHRRLANGSFHPA